MAFYQEGLQLVLVGCPPPLANVRRLISGFENINLPWMSRTIVGTWPVRANRVGWWHKRSTCERARSMSFLFAGLRCRCLEFGLRTSADPAQRVARSLFRHTALSSATTSLSLQAPLPPVLGRNLNLSSTRLLRHTMSSKAAVADITYLCVPHCLAGRLQLLVTFVEVV